MDNTNRMVLHFLFSLLVASLLSLVTCEHENHHYSHNDEKWPLIISKLEFLWKSSTVPSTTTENSQSNSEGHYWSSHNTPEDATEGPTTPIMLNGTLADNIKDAFKASLALLIGVPIAGLVVLCCCCYCICKCCCACCESEEKGNVIVLQQNTAPAQVLQPQIIVQQQQQQPMYQQPYPMQQQPTPQWAQPPPQYGSQQPYENPNYPSAPPQYGQKY